VIPLAIGLALCFGVANGVHDAGNAIAAPIVTGALRPSAAVAVATFFHVVGALVVGTAVAATLAGIVSVPAARLLPVLVAAIVGALAWNLLTLWRGLPCSSGHCLVGALAGAALAEGGGHAVRWGGLHGIRPVGVVGSLVWLLGSSAIAVPLGMIALRAARGLLKRATRAVVVPIRRLEVVTTAALALAHGSNDAQKTMGLMALALVAGQHARRFSVPLWVELAAAGALSLGTSFGGWRVVRTLGRGIYRLRALEGLVSQGSASLIVLVSSLLGAPVSTTDVVAPSVVGVGGERLGHVRWRVVTEIGLAWVVTLPVSGALAAAALPVVRALW